MDAIRDAIKGTIASVFLQLIGQRTNIHKALVDCGLLHWDRVQTIFKWDKFAGQDPDYGYQLGLHPSEIPEDMTVS